MAGALPNGEKQIVLVAGDGEQLRIGKVDIVADGEGARIAVTLDAPQLQDEFLSMRPFRCLAGAKEKWCHLPYPYETAGRITAADLTDLEYALLFLFKPPSSYGIDAWNGLYFKLAIAADGAIEGRLHETNLEVLAVPPVDRRARVIQSGDLTPADLASHRFARVVIR